MYEEKSGGISISPNMKRSSGKELDKEVLANIEKLTENRDEAIETMKDIYDIKDISSEKNSDNENIIKNKQDEISLSLVSKDEIETFENYDSLSNDSEKESMISNVDDNQDEPSPFEPLDNSEIYKIAPTENIVEELDLDILKDNINVFENLWADISRDDFNSDNVIDETEKTKLLNMGKILEKYETFNFSEEGIVNKLYIPGVEPVEVVGKLEKIISDKDFDTVLLQSNVNAKNKLDVPLLNSGFIVRMRGITLYQLVDIYKFPKDMNAFDYELKKYNSIIDTIMYSIPTLNGNEIAGKLCEADFNMLIWGNLCTTQDEVKYSLPCEKTGEAFMVSGSPLNLVHFTKSDISKINGLKMLKRRDDVESLTEKTLIYKTGPINIHLGFYSIRESILITTEIKKFLELADSSDDPKIKAMVNKLGDENYLTTLFRSKKLLINGYEADTLYKKIKVLMELDYNDFKKINKIIEKLDEMLIKPEFGFKDIVCPVCGEKHTYPIEDFGSMVFTILQLHSILEKLEEVKMEDKNMMKE